jgi:iron complex transport system substrate-binding protein
MRRLTLAFGAAAALVAASALVFNCASVLRADEADAGDKIQAERILSLGGDVTEILYDLGQADKIIAVDSTSQFPARALKDKKNVGYLRALSAEGVISVNPTIIIASEQAGPPEVVTVLKSTNVRYVEVASKPTADGVPAKVRFIGGIVGTKAASETLAKTIEADFAALGDARKDIKSRKRALFILAMQNGRATVGGTGTDADAMLRLAGADNAAAGVSGWKPVSDEQLAEFAPDAVVVMRRGDGDRQVASQALALPGLGQSPAAKSHRLIEMDGLYLLGFGPRAAKAARDLMTSLYSDASQAASATRP